MNFIETLISEALEWQTYDNARIKAGFKDTSEIIEVE
jgi:hypothetical protein